MLSHGILAALAPGLVAASRLYITSYGGKFDTTNVTVTGGVSTVDLPAGLAAERCEQTETQVLTSLAKSDACGPTPSWLTHVGDILYCTDEGFTTTNTALVSLKTESTGSLVLMDKNTAVIGGPVSSVLFGNGKALAIPGYAAGGITTHNISDPNALTLMQNITFTLPPGGSGLGSQGQPRAHQTILDPTGNFLLVPDLGSDLVRIFSTNNGTLQIAEAGAISLPRGSGPRHGVFVKGTTKTFFYVVTELTNNVFGYEVTYGTDKTISFVQVHASNTHGEPVGSALPNTTVAAEISLSPDSNFIVVSSRLEASLTIPHPDPSNSTMIQSDPLITFSIQKDTGKLAHLQTKAMGGINPRHFSFNGNGTLVAAVSQNSNRVTVIARDPTNGLLGDIIATIEDIGEPNFVIFDDA
ncbi:Lactonase, 7-bladed beta-propeller-domain-containing protein [Podospora conica]|nr:Lactonase, 7-bladed beta-propeller-domain-containing protein [Schizothecium conicum]